MRHRKKSEKFSRSRAQRKALVKLLLRAVIVNERITTITSRAKYMRGRVDRLITWAKADSLHHRRLAYRVLEDHRLVKKLFENIGPRFKNVVGGYTRALKVGIRKGDGASLSILELTNIPKRSKSLKEQKTKPVEEKKEIEAPSKKNKIPSKKEIKPKKGLFSGAKKVLKKERDAL